MSDPADSAQPDSSAVRVALWRALHLTVDAPPPVFVDEVGLTLAAPPAGWQQRPDMHSQGTAPFRASILARARFIEDRLEAEAPQGLAQYVILGAGLDSLAQRRPDLAQRLRIFEIDRPGPQAWKRQRLVDCGYDVPERLRFVPVDFESGEDWPVRLRAEGFDAARPALIVSTGVSMYLARETVAATLRACAALAPGSTLVMSFMLPFDMADAALRPSLERAAAGAAASGTPFRSQFRPAEMLDLACGAGFKTVEHVSADALAARYFAGRSDGLRPPANCEELLVAGC
jgi:methyltransferase (TIGR00027 family)